MRIQLAFPGFVSVFMIASAQAAFGCTNDVLMLDNQRIAVQLCDLGRTGGADSTQTLRFSEHLQLAANSLDHQTVATVPSGPVSPEAIDVINLAPLGLSQKLHITVRLTAKGPQIEHAIITPGPVILR
jgi:hypothetical protein